MLEIERDRDGRAHVVFLSGGKDSTAMAVHLAEIEPRPYTWICTPTGDELPEMYDHWRRLGDLLGKPLIPITAHTGLKGICSEQGALPNQHMRFCTRLLKLRPAALFLGSVIPCVSYVGLRADEEIREGARRGGDYLAADVDGVVHDYPLQRWGWDISRVFSFLEEKKIEIPERTDCARCFYQTMPEWWRLWRDHPDIFDDAIAQETLHGRTFRTPKIKDGQPVMRTKGSLTYESSWRDSWPVWLKDMKTLFELGYIPRGANQLTLSRPMMCRVCEL